MMYSFEIYQVIHPKSQ